MEGGARGWRGAISLVPDQDVDEHGGDLAHLWRVAVRGTVMGTPYSNHRGAGFGSTERTCTYGTRSVIGM